MVITFPNNPNIQFSTDIPGFEDGALIVAGRACGPADLAFMSQIQADGSERDVLAAEVVLELVADDDGDLELAELDALEAFCRSAPDVAEVEDVASEPTDPEAVAPPVIDAGQSTPAAIVMSASTPKLWLSPKCKRGPR